MGGVGGGIREDSPYPDLVKIARHGFCKSIRPKI